MRKLDDLLRNWRVAKAMAHIRPTSRLLDVGCFDGYLLQRAAGRVTTAVGLDPMVEPGRRSGIEFVRGSFCGPAPFDDEQFDCITMLAVLEHLGDPEGAASECFRMLRPGGRVILTVPSPFVDRIIRVLQWLRLLEGVCAHQHHGYDVEGTPMVFRKAGFRLAAREEFQLGLNHLFVFIKPPVLQAIPTQPQRPPAPAAGELVTVG